MKNSKLRRALLLLASAVLLVSLSVGATLAYLTSMDEVTNSFSIGKVKITLDEGNVYDELDETDEFTAENNGKWINRADNRVKDNLYKMIPGREYDKDPTIHVEAGSEECYLFVKVENGIVAIEAANVENDPATEEDESEAVTIAAQMEANGWVLLEDDVYYLDHTVDASKSTEEIPVIVFEHFTLADDADIDAYVNETIHVTAYAVQAEGFNDAEAAWDATYGAN